MVTPNDDGSLDLLREDGKRLVSDLRFALGVGDETIEMQTGSYLEDGSTVWTELIVGRGTADRVSGDAIAWTWTLTDSDGEDAGTLRLTDEIGFPALAFDAAEGNRVRWDAACTGDDHFAGLGQHAMDVDHVGEAFPLWVSEPGIGKVDDDDPPEDWYLTGTRHASSYPEAFLVRPEPVGLLVGNAARTEVDLCTADRWRLDTWAPSGRYQVIDADTPMGVVAAHSSLVGRAPLPPDWAFAPWNDAVGGAARVTEVATTLRAAGAPASVIWTEDWKGGEDTAWGYHLLPSWSVDTGLYPDTAAFDAGLEALGFKWFAYFSPFVVEGTVEAEETAEFLIQDTAGDPYWFLGVTFENTSVLDLTRTDAVLWAQEKMQAAVDLGFDGWMADYAEWFPADAVVSNGSAEEQHNLYPLWWQSTNEGVLGSRDATFFTRSGWSGSTRLSPIGWAGDQRTSFDADDGLPTVLPMGIGAGISGIGMYGSDIGGYQSIGNAPSTKELWFRWCALGAFSPVMRTHHGAFADDNWQFDSDAETLAHYARYASVHALLFPYLRGVAQDWADAGIPMIRAPFLVYPTESWDRIDAWLLGDLLVAPVMEAGASSRQVDLPSGPTQWYDWWSGAPVVSGTFDAPMDAIPVFAPSGSIVPMYETPPDTLVAGPLAGVRTQSDVDVARVVHVYAGADGAFTEADGTAYTSTGTATGSGSASASFASGTLEAGGVTLTVTGGVSRLYTLNVHAP